jgi:hypothetical protein
MDGKQRFALAFDRVFECAERRRYDVAAPGHARIGVRYFRSERQIGRTDAGENDDEEQREQAAHTGPNGTSWRVSVAPPAPLLP